MTDEPFPCFKKIVDQIKTETFAEVSLNDCKFQLFKEGEAKVTLSRGDDTSEPVDLDLFIGNHGGQLVWGGSGFSVTCTLITVTDDGILKANCPRTFKDSENKVLRIYEEGKNEADPVFQSLDLKKHLIYDRLKEVSVKREDGAEIKISDIRFDVSRGQFGFVPGNSEFSKVIGLAAGNWMQYAIIAQPDMGTFLKQQPVKNAVTSVAARTVAKVMYQTELVLTKVLQEALKTLKEEAMSHIEEELTRMIKTATLSTAYTSGRSGFVQMENFSISNMAMAYDANIRNSWALPAE